MSTTTPRQGPLSPQPEAESGRFDPGRTEGAGAADTLRNLRTALLLGWRVEFELDGPGAVDDLHDREPVASVLLLLVVIS